jgi:hypothetical protein
VVVPAVSLLAAGLAAASAAATSYGVGGSYTHNSRVINCAGAHSNLCVDVADPSYLGYGHYVGHDEPSLLFYSNQAGAGNNDTYLLRLPPEPPVPPNQSGTGGTYNFQLHPAFWFGMAMCDTQSYPLFTHRCKADSDANIFNSPNPSSPRWIGHHPGTAFMEMQFYPPGWAPFELPGGISCSATQWCAALNIDSLAENPATGAVLNSTCAARTGLEYVNFAFITKNGHSQAPANPVQATSGTYTPNPAKDLFMKGGDILQTSLRDTASGLQVVIKDLTSGQTGSMTASTGNGFGQVKFAPTGTSCVNLPYDFHPMYSTSSPATRVPWAAHSYNTAFSDEIGHWEYCAKVDTKTGTCAKGGADENGGTADRDDTFCLPGSVSFLVKISGCAGSDTPDFDGPSYRLDWPGTGTASHDAKFDPQPIVFASPVFNGTSQYSRVAFESDMPRIERSDFGGKCNEFTGAHCVNPPPGARFYPIYTTRSFQGRCLWQLGGAHIPGTTMNFGGTSKTEYGTHVLKLFYQSGAHSTDFRAEDFRNILSNNPC